MAQFRNTVNENPYVDKLTDMPPQLVNPIYQLENDNVEVQEVIYSFIDGDKNEAIGQAAEHSQL